MIYDKVNIENGWPSEVISKDGKLKLVFVGSIEPNNGRLLLKVNVIYEGERMENRIFRRSETGVWNYVQMSVNKLTLASENNRCYFIPTEDSGVILYKSSREIFQIPGLQRSSKRNYWRFKFVGNFFFHNNLIVFYSNQIVMVDVLNKRIRYYLEEGDSHIYDRSIEDNEIYFCFYRIEDGERKEYRKQENELPFISLSQVGEEKKKEIWENKVYITLTEALENPKEEIFCLEIETDSSVVEIPKDIFDMPNLTRLTIIETSISEIPSKIGELKHLEFLNLSYNKINIVDERIAGLVNLKTLNLAFNQLNSLPESICNMKQLKLLDLRGNNFDSNSRAMITETIKGCEIVFE